MQIAEGAESAVCGVSPKRRRYDRSLHGRGSATEPRVSKGSSAGSHSRESETEAKILHVARLSPLVFDHINLLGRYAFSVPDSVIRGELRPLRNPADALEDVA